VLELTEQASPGGLAARHRVLVIGWVLTTQMLAAAGVGNHSDQAAMNSGLEC
jgi:hypothetical protein